MNLREQTEAREAQYLSPYAALSSKSQGREHPIEKCDIRTDFQRDRDRIAHCKAFRRLMHKTQVFISPEGDHYRTRLTHTLEVTQIARTIARALRLNEDLTEAIALGHDLGHTPFGHTGEDAINHILPDGFRHNEQSVRVVTKLENGGKGLNLTREVIDGIYAHRSSCTPATLEGKVVQLSDKIAYINHDIDDAIRAGVLNEEDLPQESVKLLGETSAQRIDFLIQDVIRSSLDRPEVNMSEPVYAELMRLRKYMFATVYQSQLQMRERRKIANVINHIFDYYIEDTTRLPEDYQRMIGIDSDNAERIVCDYIAGMTDRYALNIFKSLLLPSAWDQ